MSNIENKYDELDSTAPLAIQEIIDLVYTEIDTTPPQDPTIASAYISLRRELYSLVRRSYIRGYRKAERKPTPKATINKDNEK